MLSSVGLPWGSREVVGGAGGSAVPATGATPANIGEGGGDEGSEVKGEATGSGGLTD